jgi:multidrug efflux pump
MGQKSEKEFGFSSWAINNSTVIWVLIGLVLVLGIQGYFAMPREDFPEVKETKIYISSVYPGNTAEDIERLITDPLEDKLKSISGVAEILSTSQEDYSIITVEFEEGSLLGSSLTVEEAKQKVKDKIDIETSGEDWPTFNGAKIEPNVLTSK